MSYQEKKSIVSLISTILINAFYFAYIFRWEGQDRFGSPEEFRFWGAVMLTLIVVSIIARILIFIIFAIVNVIVTREEMPKIEDELDKLIELKSTRNSMVVFGVGFVLALVTLVINGVHPTSMFVVLICSGIMSEIVNNLSSLYYYRKGV